MSHGIGVHELTAILRDAATDISQWLQLSRHQASLQKPFRTETGLTVGHGKVTGPCVSLNVETATSIIGSFPTQAGIERSQTIHRELVRAIRSLQEEEEDGEA